MTSLEKQHIVENVLSRMCGNYGKCQYCDFFNPKDDADGKYFCAIRDSENRMPFENDWDIASGMISD